MFVKPIKALLYVFLVFFAQSNLASHGSGPEVDIKEVVIGQGVEAKPYSAVEVHYTGKLESGVVFDSSVERAQPFKFTLGTGQVIPGWDIGVRGMKTGGKRSLKIPAALAYGAKGVKGVIPPNATLIFDVELIAATPPPFSSIDSNELATKLEKGVKLIDIRRPEEWKYTGVVEGSIRLTAFDDRGQFQKSFIKLLEKTITPDEEFAVICQTGGRTAALSNWLATKGGYKNVLNIQDGIKSWISEGRSVSKPD
ncbi:MAG: rhodanese-related sulfurtransferase [Gammaproteobacteria bacterium]|jgi:rhodanese-related sulfurtransferase